MNRKVVIVVVVLFSALGLLWLYKSMYHENDPMVGVLKEQLAKVDPSFRNMDIRSGTSAYTENKSVIYMCVKDPHNGQYYSMNTLVYVSLHEISHMLNKTYGHNADFKNIFSNLLKKAEAVGIYNPSIPIPNSYCGVENFEM